MSQTEYHEEEPATVEEYADDLIGRMHKLRTAVEERISAEISKPSSCSPTEQNRSAALIARLEEFELRLPLMVQHLRDLLREIG